MWQTELLVLENAEYAVLEAVCQVLRYAQLQILTEDIIFTFEVLVAVGIVVQTFTV
jgi:hypothetical protein